MHAAYMMEMIAISSLLACSMFFPLRSLFIPFPRVRILIFTNIVVQDEISYIQ